MAKQRGTLTEEVPEAHLPGRFAAAQSEHIVDSRVIHLILLATEVGQKDVHVLIEEQSVVGIFRGQFLQFGDHPFQRDIAELHRVIGFVAVQVALGEPTSANVAMIPGKIDLFDILAVDPGGFDVLLQQSHPELASTFIDGYGMSNVLGGAPHGGQIGFASEGQIEVADRIDGIPQAQEMHSDILAAEGHPEFIHPNFVLLGRLEAADAVLVILIDFVGKWHHLFVALGQQPDGVDHARKEAGGEGAPGEAEDVYFVPIVIIAHDEAIGADDVGIKGGAEALIDHLRERSLEASPNGGVHRFLPGGISSNPSCQGIITSIPGPDLSSPWRRYFLTYVDSSGTGSRSSCGPVFGRACNGALI